MSSIETNMFIEYIPKLSEIASLVNFVELSRMSKHILSPEYQRTPNPHTRRFIRTGENVPLLRIQAILREFGSELICFNLCENIAEADRLAALYLVAEYCGETLEELNLGSVDMPQEMLATFRVLKKLSIGKICLKLESNCSVQ